MTMKQMWPKLWNEYLLARANHTGTQVAATIIDFDAAASARVTDAAVAALIASPLTRAALSGIYAEIDSPMNTLEHYSVPPVNNQVLEAFVRADSATALGGNSLAAVTGTWGIKNEQAYAIVGGIALTPGSQGNDVQVSSVIALTEYNICGIAFRTTDDTKRLSLSLDYIIEMPHLILWKRISGVSTMLGFTPEPSGMSYWPVGAIYALRVTAKGDQIKGYLNGDLLIDITLTPADLAAFDGGKCGLRSSFQNSSARFVNFCVSSI